MTQCQETLRTAMAIGADRGILVETSEELQPVAVAKLRKAIVDKEQPQLIILGKQAIDDAANQTGQMLAALAGLPQATFAKRSAGVMVPDVATLASKQFSSLYGRSALVRVRGNI